MEEEKKVETFDNITGLTITGGGDIYITSDGVIEGASKVVKKGSKLEIEGIGGMNMTSFGGNGSFNFNNAWVGISNVNCCVGNGNSVSICNGSVVQGNINFSGGGRNNNIAVINGRRIDLNKLDQIAVDKDDDSDKKMTPTYQLGKDCIFVTISVKGSATIHPIPLKFLTHAISAQVTGSGDIILPDKHFDSINASVTGSGDIYGNNTTCDSANINVQGSGDISKIHIKKSGSINVMGSGDVYISANNPKDVMQNVMGSGSVKVKRVQNF